MAGYVSGLILKAEIPNATAIIKLVGVVYGDCADDDGGNIYPSKPTVAKRAACSLAAVKKATAFLIEAGILEVEAQSCGGCKQTTRYRMNLDVLHAMVPQRSRSAPEHIQNRPPQNRLPENQLREDEKPATTKPQPVIEPSLPQTTSSEVCASKAASPSRKQYLEAAERMWEVTPSKAESGGRQLRRPNRPELPNLLMRCCKRLNATPAAVADAWEREVADARKRGKLEYLRMLSTYLGPKNGLTEADLETEQAQSRDPHDVLERRVAAFVRNLEKDPETCWPPSWGVMPEQARVMAERAKPSPDRLNGHARAR